MNSDDSNNFVRQTRKRISFFSPIPSKQRTKNLREQKRNNSIPTSRTCSVGSNTDGLIQAIKAKDVSSFSTLLLSSRNIDVNKVVWKTLTLLHLAVQRSDNEPYFVTALLRRGGDPNNMNVEQKVSPLHLSAYFDYDRVMKVLVQHGGDLALCNGDDGESCFDIVRRNVEENMLENCFNYLFPISKAFRKSIGISLYTKSTKCNYGRQAKMQDSGSDGLYSCQTQVASKADSQLSNHDRVHGGTVDEYATSDVNGVIDVPKKLATIHEESGGATTASSQIPTPASTLFPPEERQYRGIGNVIPPRDLFMTDSVNEPFPDIPRNLILPQPNLPKGSYLDGLKKRKPNNQLRSQVLLTPKKRSSIFSPELQAGIKDMTIIHQWGNVTVDFLQGVSTANTSKSFYNYLLLDPRVIKRVNFSGDYLKSGIIQNGDKFLKFLESVFYIGKAYGKRPIQLLMDAKQKYVEMGRKPVKHGDKIDKILEIWKSGLGVVMLGVHHHSSETEANVKEACMNNAMGFGELSSIKGSYDGTVVANWPQETKNQLGSRLLFNSYKNFVVDSPKMLYPKDF